MANPTQLATDVNDLTDVQIEELNNYFNGGITLIKTGASTEIQDIASDLNGLSVADRATFKTELNTKSGGSKGSHFPC